MDSRDIEGAGCDADLEARLYAEIHYSNETYPDHMSNPIPPLIHQDAFSNPSNNMIPPMPAQYSTLLPQCNPPANAHGYTAPHNQWAIDPRPNHNPNNPTMYPENHQTFGLNTNQNNPSYHPTMNYSANTGMFSKRPRALLDIPLNPQYNYPSYQNASMPPPSARYNSNRGRGRNNHTSNMQPPYSANVPPRNSRFNDTNRRDKRCETITKNKPESTATHTTSKDTTKDNPRNNSSNKEPSTSTLSTVTTDKSPTNSDKTAPNPSRLPEVNADSTSKYNVAAKTNQQPRIKPSTSKKSDEVSSDSDESIFEVPVPPKPAPLLINLNDSGDELSSSDEEQSPVIMGNKSSESQPPPPGVDDFADSSSQVVSSILPTSSRSNELSGNNSTHETRMDINNEELSNDIDTIPSNIIINCTQVTTGVTTLADIKRLRESTVTSTNNLMSDEDSMTESEAMKWGQIEGQMTGNNDGENALIQFPIQNPTNSVDKTIGNATGVDKTVVGSTSESTSRQVDDVFRGESDSLNLERGVSRKRSRLSDSGLESGEKSNDNGSKRRKSTKEMSFEEYVFQQMPKQLEQFYNEPRGGAALLDVHKIQSRMPNNPNRWAILDADKGNNFRSREKRKICATCQRTGHTRDKCPTGRPVPKCHMCGEVGHYEPRCPHSMCLTCGTKYSSYRKTCENCRNIQCNTCKSQGHTNENCPDLWRRYHQTTSGTSVNVPTNPFKILKPLNELSCSNCTKTGHHSTNCKRNRWTQHFLSPRFVSSYTKGPYYPQDEITIDDCDTNIIDLVDDDDDEDEDSSYNNTEKRTIDKSPRQLFYEYSNVSTSSMKSWPMKTILFKRINKLFHERTNFFKRQFPIETKCSFAIRIYQSGSYYEIIIRTPSEKMLMIFEKLIRQVFNERRKMKIKSSPPLPWNKSGLLSVFMIGLQAIVDRTKPNNLRYGSTITSIETQLKSKKITATNRQMLMNKLAQAKSILLMVSYNFGLIPDARETLNELQNFMKILAALSMPDDKSPVPPEIYMTAVWFKLELFTAYVTEEIITAAAKTRKKFQRDVKLRNQMKNKSPKPSISTIIKKNTLRKLQEEISRYSTINSVNDSEVQISSTPRGRSGIKRGNESTPQFSTEQLKINWSCNGDVFHDDDSNDVIFLNTASRVGSTSNNDERMFHVNSTVTNDETLEVSTSTTANMNERNVVNNANANESKIPFDFPRPVLRKIIGKKGLIEYAEAAVAFARKNNLTSMIPKLVNAVHHARIGLISKKDMLALWLKLNSITPGKNKGRRSGAQKRRLRRSKKSRIQK